MTEEKPNYNEPNYEDKTDYKVVKSYESINKLAIRNSNLFSILLFIIIVLITLVVIFQFQTTKKLEKQVQILEEKRERLQDEVETLEKQVQILEEKREILEGEVETLEEKVQILEEKVGRLDDK